jgi:hypothetical protein
MKILKAKTEIPEFLKIMDDAQDDFNKILDAIQAHRPFYKDLFKLYIKNFHLKWTELASDYYNTKIDIFGVSQFLNFYFSYKLRVGKY